MNQIVEYKVVTMRVLLYNNTQAIENLVKKEIADGWQPIGGPTTIKKWMHQAMVKYAVK